MPVIQKKDIKKTILKYLDSSDIEKFVKSRSYILIEVHPDGKTEMGTKKLAQVCNDNVQMMDKFREAYAKLDKLTFASTERLKHRAQGVSGTVTGEKNLLLHLCDDLSLQLKLQQISTPTISI